jgi:acetoacetyl-CoA reductase
MHERNAGRAFHAYEVNAADFGSCARCAKRVLGGHGAVYVLISSPGHAPGRFERIRT